MTNDAARHEFEHVFALVQGQMGDLKDLRQRQSALAATASAADGTVEVTVNGQRMITKTMIDDSFLDEFDLKELGGFITRAAQAAAQEVERRAAAMITPMNERRKAISEIAAGAIDVPELPEMLSRINAFTPDAYEDRPVVEDGDDESPISTVRR